MKFELFMEIIDGTTYRSGDLYPSEERAILAAKNNLERSAVYAEVIRTDEDGDEERVFGQWSRHLD